jgi:hypothetical protein
MEPFLGVFPAWVGDLLSILGLPAILLALVVYILGRKQANRKMDVDEGTLKKTEFDSFTDAQTKEMQRLALESRANKDEADENADRIDTLDELYDGMRDIVFRLRSLLQKIIAKTGYQMTPAELAELEATKPLPRPPRKKGTHG